MHITTEGVEFGVQRAGDSIKFVRVSGKVKPKALINAINNAKARLNNDQWRAKLLKKTPAVTEALARGSAKEKAASGITFALEVSLEKWCK